MTAAGTQPGNGEGGAIRPDRGLSRARRLTSPKAFREAFEQKRCFPGRYLVLWLRSADDAALRLGVVTSRRTFRRAVDRSRARRLLREAWRLNRWRFDGPVDVVLLGRRAILSARIQDVERDLLKTAKRAGLMKPGAPPYKR